MCRNGRPSDSLKCLLSAFGLFYCGRITMNSRRANSRRSVSPRTGARLKLVLFLVHHRFRVRNNEIGPAVAFLAKNNVGGTLFVRSLKTVDR